MILYRVLNNLKQRLISRGEAGRAGVVVEQMLVVQPETCGEIRDRGLLLLEERAYARAAEWLQRYLKCRPDAADGDKMRRAVNHACDLRARLN